VNVKRFAAIACGRTHGCRSELHRDTPVPRLGPGWFSAPLSRARSPQRITSATPKESFYHLDGVREKWATVDTTIPFRCDTGL
jgi:hypothetical protein